MVAGTIHEPSRIIAEESLSVDETSRIDSFCLVNARGGVDLRRQSVIHAGSHVVGDGGLTMGPRAVVTYNCVLVTSTADLGYPASSVVPAAERRSISGRITLESETFVGSGAVLMPGVTVGEGGVVAATAYVDRDVPPWTIRYADGSEAERDRRSERFETPDG